MVQITKLLSQHPIVLSHSINVFLLTSSVLEHLQLTEKEQRCLLVASLLHDIGKGYWPERWHTKPKHELLQTDLVVMQAHPIQGVNDLKEAGISDPLVLQLVEQHHERSGGKGYPYQLETVHPLVLVLAACDVYAACTEPRPYRDKSLTTDETMREVEKFAPRPVLKALSQKEVPSLGKKPLTKTDQLAMLKQAIRSTTHHLNSNEF